MVERSCSEFVSSGSGSRDTLRALATPNRLMESKSESEEKRKTCDWDGFRLGRWKSCCCVHSTLARCIRSCKRRAEENRQRRIRNPPRFDVRSGRSKLRHSSWTLGQFGEARESKTARSHHHRWWLLGRNKTLMREHELREHFEGRRRSVTRIRELACPLNEAVDAARSKSHTIVA